MKCPKCKFKSGDDWKQCNNSCPIIFSPYFNRNETKKIFNRKRKIKNDNRS